MLLIVSRTAIFDNFASEIDKIETNLAEITLQGHEPNGAPQLLYHIKEFKYLNGGELTSPL